MLPMIYPGLLKRRNHLAQGFFWQKKEVCIHSGTSRFACSLGMDAYFFFGKKKKYASIPSEQAKRDVPEGLMKKCSECHQIYYRKEMRKNLNVCPNCGYHHPLNAWERIESLFDKGTFQEWDRGLVSTNPLDFPGYEEKLDQDQQKTGLNEGVVTGKGLVEGQATAFAVMDARFRMGSMGSVIGEKM